jgi:hypothetical protein
MNIRDGSLKHKPALINMV